MYDKHVLTTHFTNPQEQPIGIVRVESVDTIYPLDAKQRKLPVWRIAYFTYFHAGWQKVILCHIDFLPPKNSALPCWFVWQIVANSASVSLYSPVCLFLSLFLPLLLIPLSWKFHPLIFSSTLFITFIYFLLSCSCSFYSFTSSFSLHLVFSLTLSRCSSLFLCIQLSFSVFLCYPLSSSLSHLFLPLHILYYPLLTVTDVVVDTS